MSFVLSKNIRITSLRSVILIGVVAQANPIQAGACLSFLFMAKTFYDRITLVPRVILKGGMLLNKSQQTFGFLSFLFPILTKASF
jgi:hypothetical protein